MAPLALLLLAVVRTGVATLTAARSRVRKQPPRLPLLHSTCKLCSEQRVGRLAACSCACGHRHHDQCSHQDKTLYTTKVQGTSTPPSQLLSRLIMLAWDVD